MAARTSGLNLRLRTLAPEHGRIPVLFRYDDA